MNFKALSVIIIAVIITLAIAIAAGQNGAITDWGTPVFVTAAMIAFGVNWLAFIPANAMQTEKFYDLTGTITYIMVMAAASILSGPLDLRAVIILSLVTIWALRLGSFLFIRVHKDGGDSRFDEIKVKPMRFFTAWTLQGMWVLLTSASALAIITSTMSIAWDIFASIGLVVWIIGFSIEVIADRQKSAFKSKAENKGKFINVGLWSWSQHPNYFGEIMLWTGITIMSLPLLSGLQWVTLISPIFVIFLLTKVSGIPTLQKKAQKRWGDDKAYQDYKDKTNLLIPMPPKN